MKRASLRVGFLTMIAVAAAPAFGRDDATKSAPIPAAEAAGKMTLPEGFTATLFASEPEVKQPIAFTIDPRGRLWVVECFSYPIWLGGPVGRDRILILEDTDGDGKRDKTTVFYDKGTSFTGIALGFGGVWVSATPNLLFFPDKDGDDAPDGPPEIKLDGWDVKAQHNMFNALTWGPDGWLWGCNGIMSNSRVGAPGTPDNDRTPINCGVWRYHPTRKTFDVVAHGTTNPWGLDFDQYGEAFITNCVIPHLFRVVPGSRFQRMYGQDFNAHSYKLMESCADHIHWAGGAWTDSREGKGKHGEAGGGHAHVGAMIYLGDNWPDTYRESVLTCNLHGHRVNRDSLHRVGSGYVAKHEKDFLFANDDWFRGMEMKYGPDGSVYLTDWSDTGECHDTDADNAHRENGRIYKIAYGTPKPVKVDLARLSDVDLVALLTHKNEWYSRTARRLLTEREARDQVSKEAVPKIMAILRSEAPTADRLRALWAAHALECMYFWDNGKEWLQDRDEHIRAWAVRLGMDRTDRPYEYATLYEMARRDPSPLVRLALASSLQKLQGERRWSIASALIAHGEDAQDATIPLMLWYGIEPLVATDRSRGVEMLADCKIPLIRQFVARRAIDADEELPGGVNLGRDALAKVLADSRDSLARKDVLDGMLAALRGRKKVTATTGWSEAYKALSGDSDTSVRDRAALLSLIFNTPDAASGLLATANDPKAPTERRTAALQSLIEARVPNLSASLIPLLDDPAVRGAALRGLAAVHDDATPGAILSRYKSLGAAEKDDAIATLSARPDYALAMLKAVAEGTIPREDVSVTVARQLLALNHPEIQAKLEAAWGSVRATSKDKVALMARYKGLLSSNSERTPDSSRGRSVFNRTCLQCHKLYDSGGDVGPDLTGSDRANPDYILENVLDPSASVPREYRLVTIATTDGRVASGIVRESTPKTVSLQTANDRIVIAREDIESMKESPLSMMPEGQLEKLTTEEFRDLIAYLASKAQVAPAAEKTP